MKIKICEEWQTCLKEYCYHRKPHVDTEECTSWMKKACGAFAGPYPARCRRWYGGIDIEFIEEKEFKI